jgi:hypothetical protein
MSIYNYQCEKKILVIEIFQCHLFEIVSGML